MTSLDFAGSLLRWVFRMLCVFVALHECLLSQRSPDIRSYDSLLNPTLQQLDVATIGPRTISGIEFKLNYEFGPAFTKRVKDSKLRYLNFMVYEKLLALDAEHNGWDRRPEVRRELSEIESDLATEELYKDDVLQRIRVPDRLITRGVESERVELNVEWIFTSTEIEMSAVIRKLRSGVPFDSLFHAQRSDGRHTDDRSMHTTRFKLSMKNPMLASIVDTMTAGSISMPVHGPDGWYLIRMVGVHKNMILTQTDQLKLRDDVRRALHQHVSDSLSDLYVRDLVQSHRPTIRRAPFNMLAAHLGLQYLDSIRFAEWKLRERTGARGLADISHLESIADDTLVTMGKGCFRMREFLEWFQMREPYATLALSSPDAFCQSVEKMIWRMIRDRLLAQRAFARGLQHRPVVKRQVAWWKDKMLFAVNKQRIGGMISDSLPALIRYYEENRRHFIDGQGRVRPFEEVREDVWREYHAREFDRKMLHEILRLRQKYGVTIDEEALRKIPVDDEHDPKAIDIYTAKTGGTFPHAAFPSIDYDWQTWN